MESNLNVIGNENSVIYYNLNNQFTNIKKIIITKEIILNSFESPDIMHLFERLKSIEPENYMSLVEQSKADGVFEINLRNDLQTSINQLLPKLSDTLMDVQIQNFNFMNSVNNSSLTVTLRTKNYSISKYYQEKGTIISSIRHLIEEYLLNGINSLNCSRIDDFQIEIYESEEIHKRVLLKKESNILQLYSTFGFPYSKPFNYDLGGEFYYSIGEDFTFYKNKQTHALVREHGKIVEREINSMDNILSNNELVIINEVTKNINDAIIELYFNTKGGVKILNVSLLENQLLNKSDNGFIINKSSKNYDKITTITLRDDLTEDTPNPKFLILRNFSEVKDFIKDLSILEKIDGLILNYNFYNPVLDFVFKKMDLDLLFYDSQIPKTLECSIDFENVKVEFDEEINTKKQSINPFNNIIGANNKENDELLDKLKNIDLSTPNPAPRGMNSEQLGGIGALAESIVSSSNSSINKGSGVNSSLNSNFNKGEKKSAIDFLVETAMAGPKASSQDNKVVNNDSINERVHSDSNEGLTLDNFVNENSNNSTNEENIGTQFKSFDDFDNYNEGVNSENNTEIQPQDITNNDNTEIIEEVEEVIEMEGVEDIDYSRYTNILATKILTPPNLDSNAYFVDSTTINGIQNPNAEIYYLTQELSNNSNRNENLKIIVSVDDYNNLKKSINNDSNIDKYFNSILINSVEDFFKIDNNYLENNKGVFLNLTRIPKEIKKGFLDETISKFGLVSLIILKEDIDLIKDRINQIENVMIRDLENIDDLNNFENKVLSFEKRFLIRNPY